MLLRPVHWRVIFGLGMTLGWLTSASAQAPHSEGLTPSDREQLIGVIMQAELETMSEETPPYLAKALKITMDSLRCSTAPVGSRNTMRRVPTESSHPLPGWLDCTR